MTDLGQKLIEGDVIQTTEKAVLIEVDDHEFWIPRSAIVMGDAVAAGDTEIVVANWFLKKAGMV